QQAMENAAVNNLRTSVNQYNERVSWWNKNEPLIVFEDVIKKNTEINAMIIRQAEERMAKNNKPDRLNDKDGIPDDVSLFAGSLSEVVVTSAFGIRREQRMLAYSSVTIQSSQLSSLGNTNVAQALAGRVAGVQVIEKGWVGSTPQIIIRGSSSLSNGGQPLYIVDGVEMDGDIALAITVNEIESISVLKGVQAAMLYGSRASEGAIVITRKRRGENFNNKQN